MDVFYLYTYSSAAWLAVQGLALVATPKLIVTLISAVDDSGVSHTEIEVYLSRAFGLALLTVAILTILLTGSVPLASSSAVNDRNSEPAVLTPNEDDSQRAPYAVPTLLVTTLFHSTLAFYNYTWYLSSGQNALALGMVGSAIVASVGLWCLLFATSKGRISRRTGADKRTSGFPFKNAEADKRHPGRKEL